MTYLLITPSEDGMPNYFLTEEKMCDVLKNPEDHGIKVFLSYIPDEDPMYWKSGCGIALLLKVEVVEPVSAKTEWRLP